VPKNPPPHFERAGKAFPPLEPLYALPASRSEAPPPRAVSAEPSRKIFFSFLEEKIGGAQN